MPKKIRLKLSKLKIEDELQRIVAEEIQKEIDAEIIRSFSNKPMKLAWERDGMYLCARVAHDNGAISMTGLRDEMLHPVQAWCVENKCGVRKSFERFKFYSESEITMFLLRWG